VAFRYRHRWQLAERWQVQGKPREGLQVLHPASSYFGSTLIDRDPLNRLSGCIDMTRQYRGHVCDRCPSESCSTTRQVMIQDPPRRYCPHRINTIGLAQ
jgi:hypothetical protein